MNNEIIRRTIKLERKGDLNLTIEALLDQAKTILGRRKVSFTDLVDVSIRKLNNKDVLSICDKHRSAEETLNKSIDEFIQSTNCQLSREEVLSKIAQVDLKKLVK